MRRRRFTPHEIAHWLRLHAQGEPVHRLCREGGFSDTTFYRWKLRHAGEDAPAASSPAQPAVAAHHHRAEALA